jgi:uncharacterized membrane protein (UPF0127 family)
VKEVSISLHDGARLCRALVADGPVSRGVGLLGKRGLSEDEGLLIVPCSSVHTWFMRFPIDVLYLSRDDVVLKLTTMPPFRMSLGGRGAAKVIELPAGRAEAVGVRQGERLVIE